MKECEREDGAKRTETRRFENAPRCTFYNSRRAERREPKNDFLMSASAHID